MGTFRTTPQITADTYARLNRDLAARVRRGLSLSTLARRQLEHSEGDPLYQLLALKFSSETARDSGLLPLANFIDQMTLVGIRPIDLSEDLRGMSFDKLQDWAVEAVRHESGTYYLFAIPMH